MVKVVQIGLGPLGQQVARFAAQRDGVRIVAAVDPAPGKVDRDLGELCSLGCMGIKVCPDLKSALKGKKADVAILTTVSSLAILEKQIDEAASAGLSIVSTCEELSFPWRTQPTIAARIDQVCRKHRVACVGTGVNPGFLMDYLPCVLSSVCQRVDRIEITRIQDASKRRVPFQQKIGAGLTRSRFKAKAAEGTLRHVGLAESMHMIAHCAGWKLDRTSESLRPIIAQEPITSGYAKIEKGMARGVEQIGRGYVGDKEVIQLHFRAGVGEKESLDMIEIVGRPTLKSVIPGGVNGDVATCAITINAIRSIRAMDPGLKTMLDLPVPGCFQTL
ncbi:MAG: dihydrodipicolinate reductase [Candidatus Sumerlaeota bacterium]|nr:dihydrodipicolinate reductase [Candidatus Sumerlaeota bacterium]